MNSTLINFGFPESIVKSYDHWSVLLRPQQTTLGSLVLACHSEAQAFAQIPPEAMTELSSIIKDIESTLAHCFQYDKINYLMLMMVDPHVHFHVIPRYSNSRKHQSIIATDANWPGPPNLGEEITISPNQKDELLKFIKNQWILN